MKVEIRKVSNGYLIAVHSAPIPTQYLAVYLTQPSCTEYIAETYEVLVSKLREIFKP